MDLTLALQGKLDEALRERHQPIARAATEALREAEADGKAAIRAQVKANFRRTPAEARQQGQNFEKSFQWRTYPSKRRQYSLNAASMVMAQADFADVFAAGGSVSARVGRLVLPFRVAERAGWARRWEVPGKRLRRFRRYSDVDAANRAVGPLFTIPARGGSILAADRKKAKAAGLKGLGRSKKGRGFLPLFFLTRSVVLPKKLDFDGPVEKARRALPALFTKHFEGDGD
jgi:hypothetical protein